MAKSNPLITSITQLAAALSVAGTKVSDVAVGKWLKHDEWKFGDGPWDSSQVQDILEWRLRTLQEDRQLAPGKSVEKPPSTNTKLKNKYLLEQIRKLETENDERALLLVNRKDRDEEEADRMRKLKSGQENFIPLQSAIAIEAKFRANGWILSTAQSFIIQEVVAAKLHETFRAVSGS